MNPESAGLHIFYVSVSPLSKEPQNHVRGMKGKDAGSGGYTRRVFLWVCMSFCVIESDSQLPLCALAWRGECEVNTILWIKPDTPNTDAKQSRKHTLTKKKT